MRLLSFEKPKKLRDAETHNIMHSSDSGVAGTYVPNMSDEDKKKWKAKHIKGKGPLERIEIRKTLGWANAKIIVYKDTTVEFSTNGKINVPFFEFMEIFIAIDEAQEMLGSNIGLTDFLKYIEDKGLV